MKTVWVITYNFSSETRVASSIDKAFELCRDEILELYCNDGEEYEKAFSELIESFKEAKDNDYYRFGSDDIVEARRADFYED